MRLAVIDESLNFYTGLFLPSVNNSSIKSCNVDGQAAQNNGKSHYATFDAFMSKVSNNVSIFQELSTFNDK